MTIYITGVGMTTFGELWGSSPTALATIAVKQALEDSEISASEVDGLVVGNMLSGMLGGQEHLGSFYRDALGLPTGISAVKTEGACASGGLAVHEGIIRVLSGMYETVIVLGVEKMTDHKPEDVAVALAGAGSDEERMSGATFPAVYAMLANAHMHQYKTTSQMMAAVAVKNHAHALHNPNAQFHTTLTIDQVLASSLIADPLHLLDCSPVTDGAAAIVISKHRLSAKRSVKVLASSVATDTIDVAGRVSLTSLAATVDAAKHAYSQAKCTPRDIQVAEVHDCFTIAEILAAEDLGWFDKGKAGPAILNGQLTLGTSKQLVVNPSGGLKGCGHPVGATGVKQVMEIVTQLRGEANKRQVPSARIGLTHNVGGSGGTAVVHILSL